MGFPIGASDHGAWSGRGSPVQRGVASGILTTLGGLGHPMPYLIPDSRTAMIVAIAVVLFEVWAIIWIQNRFMDTPVLRATFRVVPGGAPVLSAGARSAAAEMRGARSGRLDLQDAGKASLGSCLLAGV